MNVLSHFVVCGGAGYGAEEGRPCVVGCVDWSGGRGVGGDFGGGGGGGVGGCGEGGPQDFGVAHGRREDLMSVEGRKNGFVWPIAQQVYSLANMKQM